MPNGSRTLWWACFSHPTILRRAPSGHRQRHAAGNELEWALIPRWGAITTTLANAPQSNACQNDISAQNSTASRIRGVMQCPPPRPLPSSSLALATASTLAEHVDPRPCQDRLGAERAAPDSGRSPVGGV